MQMKQSVHCLREICSFSRMSAAVITDTTEKDITAAMKKDITAATEKDITAVRISMGVRETADSGCGV